ncbi:unnamed protein product, partial [Closterium sp. NIES-53]
MYNVVVARYSSSATAAPGRLLLPYLFPELSAFATVEDLVTHLRTSDARYRAALPAEFLDRNPPPMYITLYFIVTHLLDSLRAVRDNFLALDPTYLTIDLLEQHLLAAETSVVAVGAARGTPRTPFFEGMSGLLVLVGSAAAARARVAGVVVVAAGVVVGAAVGVVEVVEVVAVVGVVAGVGALVAAVVAPVGVAVVVAVGVVAVRVELSREEVLAVARGSRSSVGTCEKPHTQHRYFSHLDDAWRADFGDEAERLRWAELLRSGVAIFDLDYDATLASIYALSVSAEGDCYPCVPLDPGIEAASLGASECVLHGIAPVEALHTFTLDSRASRYFFRDSTTLTPLSAPVPVRLADPSGGPVLAHSSTVLPCPAVPTSSLSGLHLPSFSTNLVSTPALHDAMVTTTTPGGERVSICTCTRTGCDLATFTRRPGSNLYTLATKPPQVAASAQVSASGTVAPPCSCRLLSHQNLLWQHRLGHPSLPHLHGMHSRLLAFGLPRSLHPLPPSSAPPCLPCVEGRQRAAPHSSFPPTTAPLQTFHMDVWGPARVSGQGRERYFSLVVDIYTRYTTVFPLRSKSEVPDVLIPWICAFRLQLRKRFRQDLPVLCLHSDRGGEFSSDLLRDFCRGEGILQTFTLPASPQQNGIAERRIGLVMEVARTSMIHAAAPHLQWPFAVRYAAHQLNRWHRVSPCLFSVYTAFDREGWQCIGVPDPLLGTVPVEVAVDLGAARGAASRGTASGGAEPEGAEPGGAESCGCLATTISRPEPLSSQQLREWFSWRTRLRSGDSGAGGTRARGTGATSLGGARVLAGAGGPGGVGAAGPGGGRTRGTGAARAGGAGGTRARGTGATGAGGATRVGSGDPGVGDPGVGDTGAGGAGPGGAGAVGAGSGDTGRPRPYFVPLLQQSQPQLQPTSPLPAPSPYTQQTRGLTERCEPVARPASPVRAVRTGRHVPHPRPPPVPGTHHMALRPSSVPLRVPLPSPPTSSLADGPDPESNLVRAT